MAKKYKVCVTYMPPRGKGRKTSKCKLLTKKQIEKLVGLPKGVTDVKITRF